MPVRLRLQRFGRTHSPFYRMVAANSRSPRDGKFFEIVRSVFDTIMVDFLPVRIAHILYDYSLERTIPLPTRLALKKYA
jgi:hypothetical protein